MRNVLTLKGRLVVHKITELAYDMTARVFLQTGAHGTRVILETPGAVAELPLDSKARPAACRVLPAIALATASRHINDGGSASLTMDFDEGCVEADLGPVTPGFLEPALSAKPPSTWNVTQVREGIPFLLSDATEIAEHFASLDDHLVPSIEVVFDRHGVAFRPRRHRGEGNESAWFVAGPGLDPARFTLDRHDVVGALRAASAMNAPVWCTWVRGSDIPVLGIAAGSFAAALEPQTRRRHRLG